MKLYGFMQDKKWYEDLGHIAIGIFLPFFGWWREDRQWPPGDEMTATGGMIETSDMDEATSRLAEYDWPIVCYPADRVADAYRDFLGYAIGDVLRTVVLVEELVRRW